MSGDKILAAVEWTSIRLWDMATKKSHAEFASSGYYYSVAFSRDGKIITTSESDGVIDIADIATERTLRTIKVKNTTGNTLALSADGRMLASCQVAFAEADIQELDVSIHVWEMATGREILVQPCPSGVNTLAFSPDGRTLLSGMNNGTALTWNVRPRFSTRLSPHDLERLWTGLTDENAGKAHEAIWTLVDAPNETVPYLRDRLKPVAIADADKVQKLIADLDSEKFAVRQVAARELQGVGEQSYAGPFKKL